MQVSISPARNSSARSSPPPARRRTSRKATGIGHSARRHSSAALVAGDRQVMLCPVGVRKLCVSPEAPADAASEASRRSRTTAGVSVRFRRTALRQTSDLRKYRQRTKSMYCSICKISCAPSSCSFFATSGEKLVDTMVEKSASPRYCRPFTASFAAKS